MPTADEIDALPAIRSRLRKLGIERPDDLVLHLPLRYEDETRVTPIAEAPVGWPVQVEAVVLDVSLRQAPRRQLVARVSDAGGEGSTLFLRFLSFYGSQKSGLEAARDGLVAVRGWKSDSGILAKDLALQMRTVGLRTVIFTDIRRDGLGSGLNIPSTRELADVSGLDVIASGGVHTLDDVIAAREAKLSGVIIGRALYDGTVDLEKALQV